MKKILSLLTLFMALGFVTPAMSAETINTMIMSPDEKLQVLMKATNHYFGKCNSKNAVLICTAELKKKQERLH